MDKPDYKKILTDFLIDLGASPCKIGFHDVVAICAYLLENFDNTETALHRCKFETACKMVKKDCKSVSKNISYMITKLFQTGNLDLLCDIFGFSISPESGKVSPKNFIFGIYSYIKSKGW